MGVEMLPIKQNATVCTAASCRPSIPSPRAFNIVPGGCDVNVRRIRIVRIDQEQATP